MPAQGYPLLPRGPDKPPLQPSHSVLCGSNGVGKSVVLQVLACLAFLPLMRPKCDFEKMADIDEEIVAKDETFVEITLAVKQPAGVPLVGRVQLWCPSEVACDITDTLISGSNFEKWVWAAESADLAKRLIQIAIANHPMTDDQWETFKQNYPEKSWGWTEYEPSRWPEKETPYKAGASPDPTLRARTYRARLLEELDNAKGTKAREAIKENLGKIGTVVYVNTDLDDHGMGLHICESPKNLIRDFSAIFHHRIPASNRKAGLARAHDRVADDWKWVFVDHDETGRNQDTGHPTKLELSAERSAVEIGDRAGDQALEPYSPKHLSSGQNEAMTISILINSTHLQNCVILFDEPELHLSPTSTQKFFERLSMLCDRFDMQTAIATHAFSAPLYQLATHPREKGKVLQNRMRLTKLSWNAAGKEVNPLTNITEFVDQEARRIDVSLARARMAASVLHPSSHRKDGEDNLRRLISPYPSAPGTIYTSVSQQKELAPNSASVRLYRLNAYLDPGNGSLKLATGMPRNMKQSVERAFKFAKAQRPSPSKRPDQPTLLDVLFGLHTSTVRLDVTSLDPELDLVDGEIGVAVFVAIFSALVDAATSPGLVVLGDIDEYGRFKPPGSLRQIIKEAATQGASCAALPAECWQDLRREASSPPGGIGLSFFDDAEQLLKKSIQ